MGATFYKNIPKHGPVLSKFLGAHHTNTRKLWKVDLYFEEKFLKMGTFYCSNDLQIWVGVLMFEQHTPPNQTWAPPGLTNTKSQMHYADEIELWSWIHSTIQSKF